MDANRMAGKPPQNGEPETQIVQPPKEPPPHRLAPKGRSAAKIPDSCLWKSD
jgi:hypothetical protein